MDSRITDRTRDLAGSDGRAGGTDAALQVVTMDQKPTTVVRRTATAAPTRTGPVAIVPSQQPEANAGDEGAEAGTTEVEGGPMAPFAVPLQDLVARVTKHGQKLLPFLHHPDVAQAHQRIVDACTLLQSASATLAATPFDPKAKAAKAGLYPGAVVKLAGRAASHYAGLFTAASRFTVISLHGARLLTEGRDGNRIFFSLKEVEIAQDPIAADTAQA